MVLELEGIFREMAKKNSEKSGKEFGKGLPNSANPIERINTREELSKLAGVGHDTMAKVKKINESGTEDVEESHK